MILHRGKTSDQSTQFIFLIYSPDGTNVITVVDNVHITVHSSLLSFFPFRVEYFFSGGTFFDPFYSMFAFFITVPANEFIPFSFGCF